MAMMVLSTELLGVRMCLQRHKKPIMKHLFTISLCFLALSLSAQETITYPYNPDGDADGYIAIYDLQDLLSTYGLNFSPGEIDVDGVTLTEYLTALNLLIEANALPVGTSSGQILVWDGNAWIPTLAMTGCTDSEACNYNSEATTFDGSCQYLDTCGVCDGPGDIYECGCSDISEGDCDCDGNQLDALNVCGGSCSVDLDEDGICDDGDSCIGEADECGVCNGPGAIYECGCTEPEPETCDCEGNVVDAAGVCGGGCQEDADADGICDSQDPCVGELDACGVCNGPGPILGCGCNNIPEGDCDCQGNQLDAVGTCGGACQTDVNGDGICDDDSIPGCTYDAACNYDPSASIHDGSCDFTSCYGCSDISACNYDPLVIFDNETCFYDGPSFDCDGNCLIDTDEDGVCDDLEIYGCQDFLACNYDASATENFGCTYPGCLDDAFCNYDPLAGCDDGSCQESYLACTDPQACNFDSEAICTDEVECVFPGCLNEFAVNYDPESGCDDGSCLFEGCTEELACNYNPEADIEDNSCEFGNCPGCTDPMACNYNPTVSEDDGSCINVCLTDDNISQAVELWNEDEAQAVVVYGHISDWDVSQVTNMNFLFCCNSFNGDISAWDVSSVTYMDFMFYLNSTFNGDLSSWDVSSVTTMSDMFYEASALSEENKCLIHFSFFSNSAWNYDWSEYCY
jgi:surface protein